MVMNRWPVRWRGFPLILVCICLLCLTGRRLIADAEAETNTPKTNVFVYPEKLTEKDHLADGPSGGEIEIKSDTTLIWVDLAPDYRFAHPTEYVLISTKGTRTVRGQWWPVLNGKPLFRNGKPYKVECPIKLTGK
jgi:hypothetical protein